MENVIFIVWRESVEALLIIGILHAWLTQRQARAALRWLWAGAAAGLGLAGMLALAMFSTAQWLQGEALDLFQALMQLAAAVLVLHMVWWLRRHGRGLKRQLETEAQASLMASRHAGLALLAMFAVGREGAETAVFLYGLAQDPALQPGVLALSTLGGVLAAAASFWALQRGRVSWPLFFRVSEVVLLCLGAALLAGGLERLIGLEYLPPLADPLWDSRAWLDDSHGAGALLAGLAGYRAQPAGSLLAGLAAYWVLTLLLLQPARRTV